MMPMRSLEWARISKKGLDAATTVEVLDAKSAAQPSEPLDDV